MDPTPRNAPACTCRACEEMRAELKPATVYSIYWYDLPTRLHVFSQPDIARLVNNTLVTFVPRLTRDEVTALDDHLDTTEPAHPAGCPDWLRPGAVVRLASGGPDMTVDHASGGRLECVWFGTVDALMRDRFLPAQLVAVPQPEESESEYSPMLAELKEADARAEEAEQVRRRAALDFELARNRKSDIETATLHTSLEDGDGDASIAAREADQAWARARAALDFELAQAREAATGTPASRAPEWLGHGSDRCNCKVCQP